MKRKAFTLIELLIVMAIMGFMGTVTVGGYRAMRRGMEDRGAMEDANQFIRAAYQRAQIDRAPVAVYFWNETLRKEDSDKTAIVVGKAIAVRRSGRFSMVEGNFLYDEFADLIVDDGDDGAEVDNSGSNSNGKGTGVFVYRLNGNESEPMRSTVFEIPVEKSLNLRMPLPGMKNKTLGNIHAYAYEIENKNGVDWKSGDAYGFEFASLQLPHGYIFGSNWKNSAGDVTKAEAMLFCAGANSGSGAQGGTQGNSTIMIYALRPDASGSLSAKKVGTTTTPTQDVN